MSTPTSTQQAGRPGSLPDRPDASAIEAARAALAHAPPVETSNKVRERVVVLMMLLVSLAIGGILHLQAGFTIPLAVLGAAAAFALSVTVNSLASRSSEVTHLRAEVARLEHELARVKTQGMPAANRPAPAESAEPAVRPHSGPGLPPEARWDPAAARRTSRMTPPGAATAPAASSSGLAAASASKTPAAQTETPEAQAHSSRTSKPAANAAVGRAQAVLKDDTLDTSGIPAWAAPSEAQGDALLEDWESQAPKTEAPSRESAPSHQDQLRMPPGRTIEADLEMVQRKIKALADEVNANEAMKSAATAPEAAQPAAIDESIAALRTTAERMKPARKGFSARPVYNTPQPPQPAPKPVPATPVQTAPIARPPQRDPQPSFANPTAAQQASSPSASGELPSLDALIPSTAQPIAVSSPAPMEKAPQAAQPRYEPAPRREEPRREEPRRDEMRHDSTDWEQDRASEETRQAHDTSRRARQPEPAAAPAPRAPRQMAEPAQRPSPAQAAAAAEDRRTAERRQQDRRILEIAAAIEQSRMDVFLNPIVGLGDYAVTHFEIDVRLKSDTGAYIDDAQATLQLQANDLLSLFDIQRLERTARVGEQLEARGKSGSLLSPTAGQSMADGRFLEAFAHTFEARTSISGQLVLTFTQADVESFGSATWQALADMNSFGFRFAIAQVSHLGMDFASLADRGFAFVKLPAEAFLDGLPAGHGMVPPADICRHLSGAGLTLVVESIDDDQLLARVFGFGALFGQGSLFGGARQITLDALGPRRAA